MSALSAYQMAPDLCGKTCLVTGANGGIGQATLKHFKLCGAKILATDIGPTFQAIDGIKMDDIDYQSHNLATEKGLQNLQSWIAEEAPDILFNNAALFDLGSVLDADLGQYDRLFAVNVRAMYGVLQAAARALVQAQKAGSLINIASQAGHRGEALVAHYCATKAAVISYTQSAALCLAPYKIRVNAISPGVIETAMWETVDALFAKAEGKAIGQKKQEVAADVPLGAMGKPEDVARVAVFLASDHSSYITAQTLGVDGGNVLR